MISVNLEFKVPLCWFCSRMQHYYETLFFLCSSIAQVVVVVHIKSEGPRITTVCAASLLRSTLTARGDMALRRNHSGWPWAETGSNSWPQVWLSLCMSVFKEVRDRSYLSGGLLGDVDILEVLGSWLRGDDWLSKYKTQRRTCFVTMQLLTLRFLQWKIGLIFVR